MKRMSKTSAGPGAECLKTLKRRAMEASRNAYAPYSRFPVGAAVMADDGTIYVGCNVENASFGLTQCAERSALTAAIAAGVPPGTLHTLLIYTPGGRIHPPCGACRQVMHELMSEDGTVVSSCDADEVRTWSRSEHLPDPFRPEALNSGGN